MKTPPGLPDNYWDVVENHLPNYYIRLDVSANILLDSFLNDRRATSHELIAWVRRQTPARYRKRRRSRRYARVLFKHSCWTLYREAMDNRKARGPV